MMPRYCAIIGVTRSGSTGEGRAAPGEGSAVRSESAALRSMKRMAAMETTIP